MEHRWGRRESLQIPIRVKWRSRIVARGQLVNASISGALASTDDRPPLWSRVEVLLDGSAPDVPDLDESQDSSATDISAYVVRHTRDGIGLEWCELAPERIARLLGAPPLRAAHAEADG